MNRGAAGPTRMRRRAYADQEGFELEIDRIFGRTWLFVAHESEIAAPGDYVTRKLGGENVIVTRDELGSVRVFLNSCPHRGTQLCRADLGNTSHFRCSYHGWTFTNSGRLRGVPERKQVFAPDWDKTRFKLAEPPHVDVFEGMIFATWSQDAPALRDELGDAAWYLKAILSKGGQLEVLGPPARALVKMNWKLGADNFCGDGYHLGTTHKSPIELGTYLVTDGIPQIVDLDVSKMSAHAVVAGNGHTMRVQHWPLEANGPAFLGYPEERWTQMSEGLDPKQIELMSGLSVFHGNIFPNLSFIENPYLSLGDDTPAISVTHVRLWQPIDPATCELMLFWLVPNWFTLEQRLHAQRANVRMTGLGGLFDVDDFQNWVSITEVNRGRRAQTADFVYDGGTHLQPNNDVGWPGTVYTADHTEVNQRELYRRYVELMTDESYTPPVISMEAHG